MFTFSNSLILGDIAFKMLDNISHHTPTRNEETKIIVGDINKNMLDVGQQRALKLGIRNGILQSIFLTFFLLN